MIAKLTKNDKHEINLGICYIIKFSSYQHEKRFRRQRNVKKGQE